MCDHSFRVEKDFIPCLPYILTKHCIFRFHKIREISDLVKYLPVDRKITRCQGTYVLGFNQWIKFPEFCNILSGSEDTIRSAVFDTAAVNFIKSRLLKSLIFSFGLNGYYG